MALIISRLNNVQRPKSESEAMFLFLPTSKLANDSYCLLLQWGINDTKTLLESRRKWRRKLNISEWTAPGQIRNRSSGKKWHSTKQPLVSTCSLDEVGSKTKYIRQYIPKNICRKIPVTKLGFCVTDWQIWNFWRADILNLKKYCLKWLAAYPPLPFPPAARAQLRGKILLHLLLGVRPLDLHL